MFELDSRLKDDTYVIGEWSLSLVLLHRDGNFPWCILVPKRANISEIYQLKDQDQQRLFDESRLLSNGLMEVFTPDKLNIAALGNVVKQLHVHHIARFVDDALWPAPIWGALPAKEYDADHLAVRMRALRAALGFA